MPLHAAKCCDAASSRFDGGDSSAHTLPAHTHTLSHTHSINHDHGSERFWTNGVGNHAHAQYVTANPNSGGPYTRQDWDGDFNGLSAYYQMDTGGGGAHDHYVDVNLGNFGGTSGGASNETTSSVGSGTAFDIRPKYFNVVYVMRVS